jgi:hypothetical protein
MFSQGLSSVILSKLSYYRPNIRSSMWPGWRDWRGAVTSLVGGRSVETERPTRQKPLPRREPPIWFPVINEYRGPTINQRIREEA